MQISLLRKCSLAALLFALSFVLLPSQSADANADHCCGRITPAGHRLASLLDESNVESLWLAHQHVNWETGEPDRGENYTGPGTHTHCSAFAASIAKRLGVYLLRPPEHGQVLLANAQVEWLRGEEARAKGWHPVSDARAAQEEANRGSLVLAVFANPDKHKPGHVAIVRPSEKSMRELEHDGPQIIQAGQHNHISTALRIGFASHPGAFPHGVRYYAHDLDLPR